MTSPADIAREAEFETLPLRQQPRGGQQVGTPQPGVLVLHKPTGIAVACEDERSQIRCRKKARRQLEAVLAVLEAAKEWARWMDQVEPGEMFECERRLHDALDALRKEGT